MRSIISLSLAVALFSGCTRQSTYYTLDGFALGTTYHIVANLSDTTGWAAAVENLFEETSASMSVYDPNSLLNRLNRNETDSVDVYIADCIAIARKVSEISGGRYDITIKPVTQAWGFTGYDPQAKPNLDSLLQFVGYDKISIAGSRLIKDDPRIQIELNSVAKGYIVDLLGDLMADFGSNDYLVEVGGEVVCRGVNPKGRDWTVQIDRPEYGNMIPGLNMQVILSFTGRGLATSGNYRKFYLDEEGNRIVHTINAVTGESSPSNLLSATVIAGTCALADAFGTMFMASGLERSVAYLESQNEVLGYLVYDDGDGEYSVWYSPGIEGMILQ